MVTVAASDIFTFKRVRSLYKKYQARFLNRSKKLKEQQREMIS
jgi:hypothetical protein